jgi:predicted CXXCH cytochrome family protein
MLIGAPVTLSRDGMFRNSSGRGLAWVLGMALAVVALPVCAQIDKSKHNLKITGPGVDRFSDVEEICVFCHTPVGSASAMVPHWNRTLPAPATYQTYDTGISALTGKVAPVGSVSLVCLSCHDGAQARNAMINASRLVEGSRGGADRTGTSSLLTGFGSSLGTDLRDDHPVGVQYGGGGITASVPTATTNDPDYRSPQSAVLNNTRVWWVGTGAAAVNGMRRKTDLALYTRTRTDGYTGQSDSEPFVECASCHDPHTDQALFLRISNAYSALCLTCHMK